MKILVTGGAGFIGSHFVRWCLQNKTEVQILNLDLLTYAGNLESISDLLDHPRHRFIKGDISDRKIVDSLLAEGVGMIFNFAAESHVDRSIDGPEAFLKTNILGTFHLLEAARSVKGPKPRFVQISTDEVYGSLGPQGKFTEETPLQPNSPYSSSKASADLMVRAYQHTFHMDTITTRCSNNYGAYQFPEKLIPLMIKRANQNESLPVYGDGLNVRDWIHVTDHVKGIWLAGSKGKSGEVYNFGADNEWPNIDIVKLILKTLNRPESLIQYVKDRPGHDRRYAMGFEKSRRELGWSPEISFPEGIKQTIDWYLGHPDWIRSVTSGDYQKFFDRWYKV